MKLLKLTELNAAEPTRSRGVRANPYRPHLKRVRVKNKGVILGWVA